jgi:hypothetical protein
MGSYDITADSVQVTVNFEVLGTPVVLSGTRGTLSGFCGDSGLSKTAVYPIEELTHFTVQLNLGRQLSALTFFTVGMALERIGNHNNAIDYLSESLNQWGRSGAILAGC